MIKTAKFASSATDGTVACLLCPADCRLAPGKHGICRSRYNDNGVLVTNNYGELAALNVDPIEKKPLYHFYPGSQILSTGPNACNLGCLFCQNWSISQAVSATTFVSAAALAEMALERQTLGVAFTYSEPIVWIEYILDVAPILRERGLKIVLVTNGYIHRGPLAQLLPWVDAFNIDLKSLSAHFYSHVCKGKLEPVLAAVRSVFEFGAHLELTNLLIPGKNDAESDIRALVDFVVSVDPSIPLHFSAYHPDYKMEIPAASDKILVRAREIAREKLNWVYLGNIATDDADTTCPRCRSVLVNRRGYHVRSIGLHQSRCTNCGYATNIRQ